MYGARWPSLLHPVLEVTIKNSVNDAQARSARCLYCSLVNRRVIVLSEQVTDSRKLSISSRAIIGSFGTITIVAENMPLAYTEGSGLMLDISKRGDFIACGRIGNSIVRDCICSYH